jgi:hypothetical protein
VAREGRPAKVALAFAIAAAVACWNPVSAPFGLVVGIAAIALSARALARSPARRVAWAGLVVAALAAVASAAELALTAGLGRAGEGTPVVAAPSGAEVKGALDRAEAESAQARERARKELDALGGGPAGEKRR